MFQTELTRTECKSCEGSRAPSSTLHSEMCRTQLRNNPVPSKENVGPPNLPSWGQKLCHWMMTAGLARQVVVSVVLVQRSKPNEHGYYLLSHGLNCLHPQLCPSWGPTHSAAKDCEWPRSRQESKKQRAAQGEGLRPSAKHRKQIFLLECPKSPGRKHLKRRKKGLSLLKLLWCWVYPGSVKLAG